MKQKKPRRKETKVQISRRMSKVKSKGTLPEKQAHAYLKEIGAKHKMQPEMENHKEHGHPDIWITGTKTFILVNGCFWHGCPECSPKDDSSLSAFWLEKREKNHARDARQISAMKRDGFDVLVIWEHDFRNGNYKGILSEAVLEARKMPKPARPVGNESVCQKNLKPGWGVKAGECCCSCRNHMPIYSHPLADGKPIGHLFGWACVNEFLGATLSGDHGICEIYEKGVNPFSRTEISKKDKCGCKPCKIDKLQEKL